MIILTHIPRHNIMFDLRFIQCTNLFETIGFKILLCISHLICASMHYKTSKDENVFV